MPNCKHAPHSHDIPVTTLNVSPPRRSGLEVITTASPHNHAMLKALGADAVFDYGAADCGAQIRAYTHNKLLHAFDCIAQPGSAQIWSVMHFPLPMYHEHCTISVGARFILLALAP